jgi:hypothetical protein
MDWRKTTTQDYRRGYVEGQSAERDAYLLRTGAKNLTEYEQGFVDGMRSVELEDAEIT